MADTMVFALIGSLIVTLTLLPVLCSWFMREGVVERRNAVFENIKSRYIEGLDSASPSLAHRRRLRRASGVRLLLTPFVGAEFMPHLDEGALWVRATMPYTISYDEAAKSRRRSARFCGRSPKSPLVASELGRPDDGTDPTGFFNVEFYVGLKPYCDWHGTYRDKPALIQAINKKLQSFPASSSTTPSPPKMPWMKPKPG